MFLVKTSIVEKWSLDFELVIGILILNSKYRGSEGKIFQNEHRKYLELRSCKCRENCKFRVEVFEANRLDCIYLIFQMNPTNVYFVSYLKSFSQAELLRSHHNQNLIVLLDITTHFI